MPSCTDPDGDDAASPRTNGSYNDPSSILKMILLMLQLFRCCNSSK
jgi:hypothetical protein